MNGPILTVTLNAALDLTYEVDQVDWHGTNRVRAVHAQAGGKGVKVGQVLQELGWEVAIAGLAGGPTGAAIRQGLAESGLSDLLLEIGGESRRTLVVAEASRRQVALFNEPGPQVSEEEWDAFLRCFHSAIIDRRAVVLGGSLPPGVPINAYAVLTGAAAEVGVAAVLDADGPGPVRAWSSRTCRSSPHCLAGRRPDRQRCSRRRLSYRRRVRRQWSSRWAPPVCLPERRPAVGKQHLPSRSAGTPPGRATRWSRGSRLG